MANIFLQDILSLKSYNEKLSAEIGKIEKFLQDGEVNKAYSESYKMEKLAEKFTNLARLVPVATGNRTALSKVTDNIVTEQGVTVEYNDKGWFILHIPALLPKKEEGNASYIRATAEMALNRYFSEHCHPKFKSNVVIIFEHIYSPIRPNRKYRDHDNIEINVIVDLIALYCLIDDSPMLCRHYYTSKQGESDCTNVYIVPAVDFPLWLSEKEVTPDA